MTTKASKSSSQIVYIIVVSVPDRSKALILTDTYRAFALGDGPLPPGRTGGVARNYSIAAKIILAAGGAFILWALIGRNLLMIYPGVVFFVFAGIAFAIGNTFRKTKQKWDELGARGIVLDAELTRCVISVDDSLSTFICHYRFTSPSGKVLTGKSLASVPDGVTDKNLPAPGTPLAVVYLDDEIFELL